MTEPKFFYIGTVECPGCEAQISVSEDDNRVIFKLNAKGHIEIFDTSETDVKCPFCDTDVTYEVKNLEA